MTRDLSRLLRPRTLAVLGGGWAETVVAQARSLGFAGEVWPVHPTRPALGGVAAYPSLSALPGAPDATFVGVNRHATLEVVAELAAMGAGGAVAFASGWQETGEAALQARLVQAAGAMPVLGPNCYGLINYLDGALLWPDQHGGRRVERGVALLSQSSNILINLTMQARALPVAYAACLGNAAQIGLAELAAALLADPRVTALGLYVEGIGDAPAFAALAESARAAGKGIVAIKSGKTPASRAAAVSHTAALAADGAASSAFLAQCGVAEVATLPELLETLKILHVHGALPGRRVCAVACSGGEAGLVADLAARGTGAGALDLAPPTPAQHAALSAVLGPLVTVANPLDYQTFIWGDGPRTTQVFADMLRGYDAGLFVIDPPRPDRCDPASFRPALDAIAAAGRITGRPAFPVASLPENFDEVLAERMMTEGVVPLMGLEAALGAVAAAATPPGRPGWRPHPARQALPGLVQGEGPGQQDRPPPAGPGATDGPQGACGAGTSARGRTWPEDAAKALLAEAGIAVPRGVVAGTLDELAPRARDLAPPLALKGLGFAHKSEAGAVRLNLASVEGAAPMPGAKGYLAEEMVAGAVAELLVGVLRDPVYGLTLTLGMGGVTAELLADTVTLVAPVEAEEVLEALRRLRLWPLLDGYRGRPRPDLAALAEVAMRLQALMLSRPDLTEIEINPLMLLPSGAVAADALTRDDA